MTRKDGIRDIAAVRARCALDDETGCWIWCGGRHGRGRGSPSAWNPLAGCRSGMGVLLHWLLHGQPPPEGKVYYASCGNVHCCNPAHRRLGRRGLQMRAHRQHLRRNAAQVARIREALRQSGKRRLSDEDVDAIRAARGETLQALAERYGISENYACSVRSGKAPRRAPPPSVFAWRP